MGAKSKKGNIPFVKSFVDSTKRNGGIIIGLLIICIILTIMSDSFLSLQNFANIMRQITVNVILACGMTMVIILGGIDLSVGSIIAVSG